MSKPDTSADEALRDNIKHTLEKLYNDAYKCGVGAKHPSEYASIESVVSQSLESTIALITSYTKQRELALLERLENEGMLYDHNLHISDSTRVRLITSAIQAERERLQTLIQPQGEDTPNDK